MSETRTVHFWLRIAIAIGTFINAAGLAFGLYYIDRNPERAVWFVLWSVVIYAVVRLSVGIVEAYRPLNGMATAPGNGSSGSNGDLTTYRALVTFEKK